MKGRPVGDLVFECVFHKYKPGDPQNFDAFVKDLLVPEVRAEARAFYGHSHTLESKQPGLDYNHPTHRIRLSRFEGHKRLFRAFDALKLTYSEIAQLATWEGTRAAKDRYEREHNVVIRDTAGDGIPNWSDLHRPHPPLVPAGESRKIEASQDSAAPNDYRDAARNGASNGDHVGTADPEAESDGESNVTDSSEDDGRRRREEERYRAINHALQNRMHHEFVRRGIISQGGVPTLEDWDLWLKHVIENGQIIIVNRDTTEESFNQWLQESTASPAAIIPPEMLAAARRGRWSEVPGFIRPVIRQAFEVEASLEIATLRPSNGTSSSSNGTSSFSNGVSSSSNGASSSSNGASSSTNAPADNVDHMPHMVLTWPLPQSGHVGLINALVRAAPVPAPIPSLTSTSAVSMA